MKWWQKIVDVLKGMGIVVPDDRYAELDKALEGLEPKVSEAPPAAPIAAPIAAPPHAQAAATTDAGPVGAPLADLVQRAVADALRPVNEELAKAKTDRDAIAQQLAAQQTKEKDQQVATLLDQAIAKGKITPAQRDQYKADLDKAFDVTKGIIERLPENPTLAKHNAITATKDGKTTSTGDSTPTTGKYETMFAKSAPAEAMKYVEQQLG